MSEGAVLIGFIVTIVIVGLLGGITLVVFICIKWRDYVKRREIMRASIPARQPTRRRRRTLRVAPVAPGDHDPIGQMDLPPPYSETDILHPPPYAINPLLLRHNDISRGNSRRNSRLTTPQSSSQSRVTSGHRGTGSVLRHSSFSVHLNIEGSQAPVLTPAEDMLDSPHVSVPLHVSIPPHVSFPPPTYTEITTQQNSSNDVT